MSRSTVSLKVSWHRASGQYIKYIGKFYGKDGSLKSKAHYLGADQTAAMHKAAGAGRHNQPLVREILIYKPL